MTEQIKDVVYYMSLPYMVEVYPDPDGKSFAAVIPLLPGCMTSADTIEQLWMNVQEAKRLWLEVAVECRLDIQEPKSQ